MQSKWCGMQMFHLVKIYCPIYYELKGGKTILNQDDITGRLPEGSSGLSLGPDPVHFIKVYYITTIETIRSKSDTSSRLGLI